MRRTCVEIAGPTPRKTSWHPWGARPAGIAIAALVMAIAPAVARAQSSVVTVNLADKHQTIDGFGVAQSGGDPTQVPAQNSASLLAGATGVREQIMDLAFSPAGIGLSLLRMKIDARMEASPGVFNDVDPDQEWVMQAAAKRTQVKIMASVWSPPGWMKSTGTTTGGRCSNNGAVCVLDSNCSTGNYCLSGSVNHANYQDYANFLTHYATQYASAHGVSIYALSMANEPETQGVNWDTCRWTASQIAEFLASYLAPTFAANHVATKVIAPEASNWDYVEAVFPQFPAPQGPYMSSTYANPSALARVDIVAGHNYAGNIAQPFQTALNAGKRIWQTETSQAHELWNIDGALGWAKDIHDALTGAQVSGWLWFLLYAGTAHVEHSGLIGQDPSTGFAASPALYAIGNFSKFVRPGFVRVGTSVTNSAVLGFNASAYQDPVTRQLVIVAINNNLGRVDARFDVAGLASGVAIPYVTSGVFSLARQAPVAFPGTIGVPGKSIVTYVVKRATDIEGDGSVDLDADGASDLCGRGPAGVSCARSTGAGFAPATLWSSYFSDSNQWSAGPQYYSTIRFPDLDNDGRADVCGRGSAGVACALGTGASFGSPTLWTTAFNDAANWNLGPQYYSTIRFPDLDNDGRADICGRGNGGEYCALNTGGGFGPVTLWSSVFSDVNQWNTGPQFYSTIRFIDLNNDGRADICGRGTLGVYCAVSTGTGFAGASLWSNFFSDANGWAAGPQYYSTIRFPDVNNDGRADICGRNSAGMYCALNTGSGFGPALPWSTDFNDAAGWSVGPQYYSTIRFPDVNNDGLADVCGRTSAGVSCSLNTGSSFGPLTLWSNVFSDANQWNLGPQFYSTIGFPDVNHDGRADVCVRGVSGVYCAPSTGASFSPPGAWDTFFSDANQWNLPQSYSTIRFP